MGRRLHVNAQLVRAADDVLLWSEPFDRTLEDVFAIQDEISRAVAGKLRLTLGRAQRRYRPDAETSELYLRARALVDRGGNDNAQRAATLFEQVIARDPTFAPAHAGAADAYASMSWEIESETGIPGLPYDEALRRMRPAAERALELDPQPCRSPRRDGHDVRSRARLGQRAEVVRPSHRARSRPYPHSHELRVLGTSPSRPDCRGTAAPGGRVGRGSAVARRPPHTRVHADRCGSVRRGDCASARCVERRSRLSPREPCVGESVDVFRQARGSARDLEHTSATPCGPRIPT